MNKNLTELVFILDCSGSMWGLEADTIGGFNSMLAKQKAQPGQCRVTTILFDSQVRLLHDRLDIQAVEPLTPADYQVGGSTALLDAMGAGISKLIQVQKSTAAKYQAGNVMYVIITDGMENASRHYAPKQIKKLVKYQQQKYGWEFIFLGANIDAVTTAASFGIGASHAADYAADQAGTMLNFEVVAQAVSRRRCGHALEEGALEEIRQYAGKH